MQINKKSIHIYFQYCKWKAGPALAFLRPQENEVQEAPSQLKFKAKKKKGHHHLKQLNLSTFQTKTQYNQERIAVSVNYRSSFTDSCIRVTALLGYLDLQSMHYAIVATGFAAQLALNYPNFADVCVTIRIYINLLRQSNLQLEGPTFWSCEAP